MGDAVEFSADMLADYVAADETDGDFIEHCARAARRRVTDYVADHVVPADIMIAAMLEVGANLFQRRQNSRDNAIIGEGDMTPAFYRPALDPLTPARAMLRPYLGPAIA